MATSSISDLYALDPEEFERLVGTVFTSLGYEVRLTKRSGDEGIDLELLKGAERSLAQCKRYRGTVGQPDIRDFYGVLVHENAARGYFVTTGQFSLAASTWAQGKPIALIDGVDFLAALENSGTVPPVTSAAAEQAARVVIAARRSPEEHLAALHGDQLRSDLRVLSPNERNVIEWRFGLNGRSPQTPESVSDELRMTLEGVRRAEAQALEKLRRAAAPTERSPDAIDGWNEEHVLRVSREQVIRALISQVTTLEEQATRERMKSCLAALRPVERLVIEMWSGFKDGRRRDVDTIADQLGLSGLEAAGTHVEALERLARMWSDSAEVGTAVLRSAAASVRRAAEARAKFGNESSRERWDYGGLEAEFILRFEPASVLDAGCGTGRVSRELARHGVAVVGIDRSTVKLAIAQESAPDLEWHAANLTFVNLGRLFDVVILAGDGNFFLSPDGESAVVANMSRHLRSGGVLITSFPIAPDLLTVEQYDEIASQAGLEFVERWSGWDCSPWTTASDYAICVHRKP